ncbi:MULTISPECIES: hypothetical protein [Streptomyces]|nr:hypothetical protein [Streptomyces filamentosus]
MSRLDAPAAAPDTGEQIWNNRASGERYFTSTGQRDAPPNEESNT